MLTRAIIPIILFFCLVGCATADPPSATPTLPPQLAQGQKVFQTHCGACHSLQPDLTIVGPSLHGIATHAADRVDGQDARTYIYTAVLNPSAYTVPGFAQLMPTTFGKTITGEDLDALVAYLLTME